MYKTIKKVKGDGLVEGGESRYFILEDETRIELPRVYEFIFSKERYTAILDRMEKETSQNIKIDKR
jgi:hypothetical protein